MSYCTRCMSGWVGGREDGPGVFVDLAQHLLSISGGKGDNRAIDESPVLPRFPVIHESLAEDCVGRWVGGWVSRVM